MFYFYYNTLETEMRPEIEEIDGKKKLDKSFFIIFNFLILYLIQKAGDCRKMQKS